MATAQGIVAYFGYGSVVNRATLRTSIVDPIPARLSGWRRYWRSTDRRRTARSGCMPPHREPPVILQSYLDAVPQGFHTVRGVESLARFFAETDGSETRLHADRDCPVYPRHLADHATGHGALRSPPGRSLASAFPSPPFKG